MSQGALPLTGITEGAKTQTDTATFVEGVSRDTTTSAQQFLQDHHGAPVTTVNGNYYQINTVFQLNIITDHTSTSQTTSGGTGGADVTSGGSLAFNTASISIDNLHNDLFVNGQYSQYNLVLQVNALQSTGSISELLHAPTSTSVLGSDPLGQASAALAATHDISPVHGTPGSVAAPLVSLPNPLDELALRGGATIDHLI